MMYMVSELSDLLGVSKVTLYKKLKLKDMEQYVIKKNNITYVDSMGIDVLKGHLTLKEDLQEEFKRVNYNTEDEVSSTIDNTDFKGLTEDYINSLKGVNAKLWEQLQEKDKQINELLLRIESLSKLVENSQVLLREQQDPLQLAEHFTALEDKIEQVKNNMISRKYEKKGFFNKLRK